MPCRSKCRLNRAYLRIRFGGPVLPSIIYILWRRRTNINGPNLDEQLGDGLLVPNLVERNLLLQTLGSDVGDVPMENYQWECLVAGGDTTKNVCVS